MLHDAMLSLSAMAVSVSHQYMSRCCCFFLQLDCTFGQDVTSFPEYFSRPSRQNIVNRIPAQAPTLHLRVSDFRVQQPNALMGNLLSFVQIISLSSATAWKYVVSCCESWIVRRVAYISKQNWRSGFDRHGADDEKWYKDRNKLRGKRSRFLLGWVKVACLIGTSSQHSGGAVMVSRKSTLFLALHYFLEIITMFEIVWA